MIDRNIFQETFSTLHTPEDTVTEVLKMANQNKRHSDRRILHTALAAALMVCLLATTVLAAPVVYRAILGRVTDTTRDAYTPTDEWGNSQVGTVCEVALDIEMNEDAPAVIETYYMPQLPDDYKQSFGYGYGGMNYDRLSAIICGWDVPDSERQGILFAQFSAEAFENEDKAVVVSVESGSEPEMRQTELGGVEGFLVLAPDDTEWGRKYFYWSDGDYVFYMRFTYAFTEAQIGEMVAGVRQLDDVRPYMVSMTEEEMAKTFGE